MTIEKIVCDECGRVKAESNHWHQIAVWTSNGHISAIGCGRAGLSLDGRQTIMHPDRRVHDLCGEQCFHKHIARLLGFNDTSAEAKA